MRSRVNGFGQRLQRIRRSRGLTQAALGEAVGISRRMVVYYERSDAQPPPAILVKLAQALRLSTDELLGLQASAQRPALSSVRLLNRLRRAEELPVADRRTLLKFLESLLENQRRRGAAGGGRGRRSKVA